MYLGTSYGTAVFCIIATEFCERFSFCGLRSEWHQILNIFTDYYFYEKHNIKNIGQTYSAIVWHDFFIVLECSIKHILSPKYLLACFIAILSLYLRNILLFSENASTVIYHVFIMGCYMVPLIGAIFADSYFGRYRTIRNFALIYLVGNVLMCLAAVPSLELPPVTCSALGLILIAVGTGGIKPCVAAFGGEQFHLPDQRELLTHFFSVFYFTINLGGFVGMILTPIMKKAVSCFGDDTCYALGFGFPAALMFLSIFLFIIGKSFYKLKTPKKNIMLKFFKCGTFALARHCKNKRRYDHWLDNARGKFDLKLIQEMKIVCAILLLYTPLPIFWSLFDQQGSRWTFQASHMDGNFMGTQIVPDQMQVVNPAMVLILIPVFDRIFYPCFSRLRILENSLHRMAFGGIVAGLAFFSAGVLELVLERTYPELPDRNHASINVVNTLPCDLKVINPFNGAQAINASEIFRFKNMVCHNYTRYTIYIEAPLYCGPLRFNRHKFQLDVLSVEYQIDTVLIGINPKDEIQAYITDPVDFQKSISGTPRIRIAYIKSANLLHNVTVTLKSPSGLQDVYFVHDSDESSLAVSAYMELPQGVYECIISSNENKHLYERNFHLALGGVYSLVIRENRDYIEFVKLYTMSVPNTVNILWQVPQYFLISVAEIMFGVAGLEFSFTQAPRSMKTVTIAGWYLSVAVGNFLVIIITQLNMFKSQAHEFFLFAVLIVADMMIFMEMASNYKFIQICDTSSSCILPEEDVLSIDLYDSEYTTESSN